MSSRLRDVLGVTVGLYFLAYGVVLLADSSGWVHVGVAGLIEAAVGLFLLALGVLSIFAAARVRRVRRRLSRAFGHVRSAEAWRMDDAVIRTVFGDISLDLRDAVLPEGETSLMLLSWIGTIDVRAPGDIGLAVEAQAFVGTLDILGRREEGVIRDIDVRSPGYDGQARRLRLRVSTVIGELRVTQG